MRAKTIAFGVLIAFQAVLLVGIALAEDVRRESGDEVILQTVPVDPRDLLRGDYVTLGYEISSYDRDEHPGLLVGQVVFVDLAEDDGVFRTVSIGDYREEGWDSDTVIRGEVVRSGWIEYGIEAYFVPEGRGHEIERAGDVKAVISIGEDHRARIKYLIVDGERWE